MKYWKEDAIFDADCPQCGKPVEFYKDDTTRKCNHCGHRFVNPKMDFGCATYCQFAEQCLGTLPEDFRGIDTNILLKEKVAVEVKRYFHTDFRRIREATNCAQFAETIGKTEQASLPVILCAAYMHGIALDDAHTILTRVGAAEGLAEEICTILSEIDSASEKSPPPLRILHDALTLVKLQAHYKAGTSPATKPNHASTLPLFTSAAADIAEEFHIH
jgi:hypothetical protein